MKQMFNVNSILLCTESEGPGKRLTIWFQGCKHNCKGCFNPEMLEITEKNLISEEELLKVVIDSKKKYSIEGITLLGGEPLLQFGLIDFLKKCRELELSVVLFTGYLKEEISRELLELIDILIDGPFIESQIDSIRPLIGSTNQKIFFLTDRYDKWNSNNYININMNNDSLIFNGERLDKVDL